MLSNFYFIFVNILKMRVIVYIFTYTVLGSAVKFTELIHPIRLPSVSMEDPDIYAGSAVAIMGWGNGTTTSLKTADIQVFGKR